MNNFILKQIIKRINIGRGKDWQAHFEALSKKYPSPIIKLLMKEYERAKSKLQKNVVKVLKTYEETSSNTMGVPDSMIKYK